MSKKTKRNITGLLKYTSSLKAATEEKVNQAIEKLKRSKGKKINFKTVSELSGISTTTLYNNPILRERISSLRAIERVHTKDVEMPHVNVREREQELKQEIQKLKEDKKMLIEQLVELENLRIENKKIKALLSQRKLE